MDREAAMTKARKQRAKIEFYREKVDRLLMVADRMAEASEGAMTAGESARREKAALYEAKIAALTTSIKRLESGAEDTPPLSGNTMTVDLPAGHATGKAH